jgi:bifunctional non-homologous end joining protein LigD
MPGATVSTPLDWDEVNEKLDPSIYTMDAVLDRLECDGDPL